MRLWTACAAALVVTGVLSLAGCSSPSATDDAGGAARRAAAAVPVDIGSAERRDVPVQVRAIGWVESASSVTIRPQIDGQVKETHFKEGQLVGAGDALFSIDARPFEAAQKLAKAEWARDNAMAQNARRENERVAALFARGDASDRERDAAQADADAKAAQVESDAAAVERARLNVEYCLIRAPIAGRVGSLTAYPGSTVKARDTSLVTLNQVSPIFVTFSVAEQHLSRIRSQMAAGALTVEARLEGDEGAVENGALTFIDNEVDRSTGMIRLKATFGNADGKLWAGQFVQVRLSVETLKNAIVVPASAVQAGQSKSYVYVVGADDTVDLQTVEIRHSAEGIAVVAGQLSGDERVVTDGQLRLVPGAKITNRGAATSKTSGPERSP